MRELFDRAVAEHRAGRLAAAAAIYRAILQQIPDQPDCLNLLGVVAHQQDDDRQAAELGERAVQLHPDRPSYRVNLATALRGLGRHDDAIRHCRAALDLKPDLAEARLALGLSLQAQKQWSAAEEQFRWLRDHRPGDSRGPQALASCLRQQGRTDEAIALFREALARNPNDAAAHLGLGTELLLAQANPSAAEFHLKRATELLPREVTAWTNYGSCLVRLGREREALRAVEEGLRLSPNDPGLACNAGQAWLGAGNVAAAENCFQAVLDVFPDFPGALVGLGDTYREADRADDAIPLYERAQRLEPSGSAARGLADALWDSGDVERAVAVLRDEIRREPADPQNHTRLATILASGGDLKAAAECCRAALNIHPGYPPALVELALNLKARLPDAERQALEAALQQPAPEAAHAAEHFGLAQVADARGEFDAAAEHLRLANAMMKSYHEARGDGYDPAEAIRNADRTIAAFSLEFFQRTAGFGVADERTVFVVGMPRSGTTLIEQILASHPRVYGAGERRFAFQSLLRMATALGTPSQPLEGLDRLTPAITRDCAAWHLDQLRRLDGGRADRVVDKMPDNYSLLGWLAVQFPNARFIHSRRDVRDVAMSCWMTNFARIRWANDLEHIATRVRMYRRLMDHWRKVLPVPLLEVDYEELVMNQEAESRRLVAWLGLEWDPACLQFHRTERLVKTASVTQVRQPMYARSVGRWRHYQAALEPFLRSVGDAGTHG